MFSLRCLTVCDGTVELPNLHLLQRYCCRGEVHPGLDPLEMAGPAPPHSPAEYMLEIEITTCYRVFRELSFWLCGSFLHTWDRKKRNKEKKYTRVTLI